MPVSEAKTPPILSHKGHEAPSAFTPESLLREARRQKGLSNIAVPEICILDPDGDIVRHLRAAGRASLHPGWACYHTELYGFHHEGHDYGIVGCAVGAAFAVLIAEELFASGCRLLISVTSAGQIAPAQAPPYFVVIDRALRDEGTSYHYLPASEYSEGDAHLTALARDALSAAGRAAVRIAGDHVLSASELPAVETMAAIVRQGTNVESHTSFSAIGTWIEANNYEIAGPCREVFLEPVTGPPGLEGERWSKSSSQSGRQRNAEVT